MALNPTSFTSYSNSLLPNTSGQGVMRQNAMPASTSENNAPNSLPTSELTTASTNPSSTTPKRTMFIAGGILSTLLAGGLLFWQRKNIASLFGKSPKPAPSQADTFVSQVVEPVATAAQHTPEGKALGGRVGAFASGAKEKVGAVLGGAGAVLDGAVGMGLDAGSRVLNPVLPFLEKDVELTVQDLGLLGRGAKNIGKGLLFIGVGIASPFIWIGKGISKGYGGFSRFFPLPPLP